MYKHHAHIMFFPFYSIQGFPLLQVCSSWSEKNSYGQPGRATDCSAIWSENWSPSEMSNQFFSDQKQSIQTCIKDFPWIQSINASWSLFQFLTSIWQVIVFFAMPFILFQNFFTYMQYRLWKRSHSCKYNFGQKFMRIAL